jgi:hypothetical protein
MEERTKRRKRDVIARLRDSRDKKVRRYVRMYYDAPEGRRTALFEKAEQAVAKSPELEDRLRDFRSSQSPSK